VSPKVKKERKRKKERKKERDSVLLGKARQDCSSLAAHEIIKKFGSLRSIFSRLMP
jgi:hypothetical protein